MLDGHKPKKLIYNGEKKDKIPKQLKILNKFIAFEL